MPPEHIPQKIADSLIKNHIDLDRFSEGLRKQIVDLLVKAQQEIEHAILDIDPGATTITEWQRDRFMKLDTAIKRILDENYGKIKTLSDEQLTEASKIVGENTPGMLNASIGVDLFDVTLTPELLQSIVENTLVGGKVIGDWWDKQSEETRLRLKNAMESVRIDLQLGLVKGESIGALIGKVRGTPIIPGPFAASKAQAAALARTSTMQVLQATRQEVYNQNADVLKGYQWVSTLDNRTTPLCRGMDGRQYDLNFQPIDGNDFPYPGGPPAHWNCRSTLIPITKSFEELIGSDKLSDEQKNALANIESESVRASMGGPVDSDMSYEEWLRGQPEETQIDILGPARHDLFKRGKITALADLIHQNGRPLNLEQLKKKMEAQ